MSRIKTRSLDELGYGFVPTEFLQVGQTEFDIRFKQNPRKHSYRRLTDDEVSILKSNYNQSNNWDDIYVSDPFCPHLIQHSKFYGLNYIGKMADVSLEYRDLELPSGIYNSLIISSDLGDYVAIHNVRYMSHFIIGDEVMLLNINEMETSNSAKFGNGMVKIGEEEERRIELELRNESGGRSIIPFDGIQPADAYLWSQYRQDTILQQRFKEITENQFPKERGYYSRIGNRSVIKNSNILKDVKIGEDAYIKGVNKIKNVTVHSREGAYTQIGEGSELVNGIIGYGCRIFYGVKAVRFVLASFSQLKYGARLINSFLGDNSTISCCEVLNSLLFPAHEQHHNNSFLCASIIKGQSNMAAGATVGSNHNSRAADGEIIAGRGFWPGLCVSLKHNSKFASYTLIVKGDFLYELDIRIPFSLVSLDVAKDELVIVPGYWFLYNMYALMRNTTKFLSRDKRQIKLQYFEYEVLAPDTVNEMFNALLELELAVGNAFLSDESDVLKLQQKGREILNSHENLTDKTILLSNTECSKRKVKAIKVREGYHVFRSMIEYYAAVLIHDFLSKHSFDTLKDQLSQNLSQPRCEFENIGSQLIRREDVDKLLNQVKSGEINNWDTIHQRYGQLSDQYPNHKLQHALASLSELHNLQISDWSEDYVSQLLLKSIQTKESILEQIYSSRQKDYRNPFKLMVYDSLEEMEKVIGKLDDNTFINLQRDELLSYKNNVLNVIQNLNK